MERLAGRVALVTGSTSGIGRGIVKLFAEEGARVLVTGRRVERGEQVVAEIRAGGGEGVYHPADLTEPTAARELVEAAVAAFGRLDILVNNAAPAELSATEDGRVADTPIQLWDHTYEAAVRSAMLCSKYATPSLISSGHGAIVNMSSIHAFRPLGWDAYTMAKAAVVGLTRSMAVNLASDGVRVNCICPGVVLVERNARRLTKLGGRGSGARSVPERPGSIRDVAYGAVYLASDEARYVTGSVLHIDGGASIAG